MSTHDYNIANASGASVRSDINNALAAILSNNSNGSSPSTTVAYSTWVDTSAAKLKIRNSANDGWVELINLDGTIARDISLTGDLTLTDKIIHSGDTNTAIRFPAADTFTVETAGSERLRVDSSGNCGIKTTSPVSNLHVNQEDSDKSICQFTNSTTGAAVGDGFQIGLASDETALLNMKESAAMTFKTADTTRMTITSAGNVGIGITSTDNNLHVADAGTTSIVAKCTDDGTAKLTLGNTGSSDLSIQQVSGDTSFLHGANTLMKIHDGSDVSINKSLIVDTDALAASSYNSDGCIKVPVVGSSNGAWVSRTETTGNRKHMRFENPNNTVGSISTSSSATTFGTSSDYRLKENVVAISDGITRLKTLKPSRFNWKVDETNTLLDGFLAHEVSSVVPEAIVGTKDEVVTQAMIDAGDYDSSKLNDPIYQEIDQSKIVPLLTAALQEAVVKIETLETKVAALEAA